MMTDFASATISWGPTATPETITLLELLKQVLGIVDAAQDTALSMYLDMSGNACEQYIDNIIQQREVTELFKNVFSPIALRYWPVQSLVGVEVDGVDKTSSYKQIFQDGIGWVLVSASDGSQCPQWFTQLSVQYSAGYDPLPTNLGYAVVQGAASYYGSAQASGGSAVVKKESVVGVGSTEYDTGTAADETIGLLPASVTSALDVYSRIAA